MTKSTACKAHNVHYCYCLWTPAQRNNAGIAMDSTPALSKAPADIAGLLQLGDLLERRLSSRPVGLDAAPRLTQEQRNMLLRALTLGTRKAAKRRAVAFDAVVLAESSERPEVTSAYAGQHRKAGKLFRQE